MRNKGMSEYFAPIQPFTLRPVAILDATCTGALAVERDQALVVAFCYNGGDKRHQYGLSPQTVTRWP